MKRSHRHSRPVRGRGRAGIPAAVVLVALLSLSLALATAAAAPRQAIYDEAATPTWTAQINGHGTSDDVANSAVATATGVYVGGTAGNAAGNLDATLARFSSSGTQQWLKRYDGAAHGDDQIAMIAKGPGGTIYGVGRTERANGKTDLLVVKWGADGSRKWARTYDGTVHKDDWGEALGVDKYGTVTVAGTSSGTHYADYVVVRWSSSGVRMKLAGKTAWRYNGSGNLADQANDVCVESGGTAYVTGSTQLSGPVQAALTVKFSAAGEKVWLRTWRGAENLGGYAGSLTPRPGGGVYIAGSMKVGADNNDAMVLRYSSTGASRLLPTLTSSGEDFFHDVTVTTGKRIVAVGYYVDAVNAAVLIWKNETAEPLAWGFGGTETDWFTAVTADSAGGFYATGYQGVSPGTSRILTIRRSLIDTNSGFHSLWGPALGSDVPQAVVAIGTRAYVVGKSARAGEGSNQVVLSYVY